MGGPLTKVSQNKASSKQHHNDDLFKQLSRSGIGKIIYDRNVNTGKTRKFTIVEQIGKGAFGTVYLGECDGDRYALKFITCATQKELIDATKEARALLELKQSRHIVKFKGGFPILGEDNNPTALCIIMEYIEGHTLRNVMEKGTSMPLERVVKWFIQLLEALNEMHTLKIVHRDIKPANIILRKENDGYHPIIVDLGVWSEINKTIRTCAGTLPYFAPEYWNQQGRVNNSKVDIWALGCVLYEVLTADMGFVKHSAGMAGHLLNNPELLETQIHDQSLRAILRMMFQDDPQNRPSAKELLNHDLILGWRAALNPKPSCVAKSSSFLMPFLSCLSDQLSIGLQLASLNFIAENITHTGFKYDLLQLKAVPRILDLLKRSLLNKNRDNSIGVKKVRMACLKLLEDLIRREPFKFGFALEIYAYGGLEWIIDKFSQGDSDVFKLIPVLSRLCRSRAMYKIVRDLGLPYFLELSMITDTNNLSKQAAGLFADLSDYDPVNDAVLLKRFLEHINTLPSQDCFALLNHFIQTKVAPGLVISSRSTSKLFAPVLRNALSAQRNNLNWVLLTRRIEPSINATTLLGRCSYLVTGKFYILQTLGFCYTCGSDVCLACVQHCHRNHSVSITTRSGYCHCSATRKCGCTDKSLVNQQSLSFSCVNRQEFLSPASREDNRDQIMWRRERCVQFRKTKKVTRSFLQRFYFSGDYEGQLGIAFFFEIKVLEFPSGENLPHSGMLSVGLTADSHWRGNLGCHSGEVSYCSKTGKAYFGKPKEGVPYGPNFTVGDVVGCGVLTTGEVFFTLNNTFLMTVPSFKVHPRQTMVACVSSLARVKFSFNLSGPFIFEQYRKMMLSIKSPLIPAVNTIALDLFLDKNIIRMVCAELTRLFIDRTELYLATTFIEGVAMMDPNTAKNICEACPRLWTTMQTHKDPVIIRQRELCKRQFAKVGFPVIPSGVWSSQDNIRPHDPNTHNLRRSVSADSYTESGNRGSPSMSRMRHANSQISMRHDIHPSHPIVSTTIATSNDAIRHHRGTSNSHQQQNPIRLYGCKKGTRKWVSFTIYERSEREVKASYARKLGLDWTQIVCVEMKRGDLFQKLSGNSFSMLESGASLYFVM